MKKDRMILRTPLPDRLCHWAMVTCFFLVAMSGLSWLFPSLNWLNGVFGTPQMARLLHPFFGIVVFAALVYLFIRFVKYNLPERKTASGWRTSSPWWRAITASHCASASTTPARNSCSGGSWA